jgi:hypothetical protein
MDLMETQPSEPSEHPTPRTDEEIDSITQIGGERLWLKNARDAGDHYFVESMFKYHANYELMVISNAFFVALENHGCFREEFLTVELLDRVRSISNALYDVIREDTCGPWFPEEVKKLLHYFTAHPDEWTDGVELIRSRGICNHDELMRYLEGSKGGAAPALIDGTL